MVLKRSYTVPALATKRRPASDQDAASPGATRGFLGVFGEALDMALVDTVMRTGHLLAGGILTGSVVFFAFAATRSSASGIGSEGVNQLASSLATVSRACAVLILVSGGYMAAVLGAALQGTAGMLVGVMIVLWLIVTALVEVGNSRLADGAAVGEVKNVYTLAALASVLLLLDAGYIAAL